MIQLDYEDSGICEEHAYCADCGYEFRESVMVNVPGGAVCRSCQRKRVTVEEERLCT